VTFSEALRAGIAPDGGLYVPDHIPLLPPDWRNAQTLPDLAVAVLEPWFGADAPHYAAAVRSALDFEVPLRPLTERRYLLELFHGPTLAFKDVGARTMARLLATDLAPGERLTILVATSGDTGSAVADGFSGVDGIEVVLLYPKGMVSEVQERQLIVERPGVRAFAVAGTFDDCQRLVKAAFADPELAQIRLSSANSINIGRLLPQMLYYLWGGLQLERELGDEEASASLVCVPSGNLGNLTAAVLAQAMGWRAGPLLAAHNANDFFPEFLAGERDAFAFNASRGTVSNAMDVGAPSNFERLHALLGDRLREVVAGESVDDDATLARIRSVWRSEGVAVCPHTAVGLEAVARWRRTGDPRPALVVATAHPAKFPDVLERALGVAQPAHPALEALRGLPTRVEPLAADLDALRARLLDAATTSG
jgi:threonine synthase